MAQSKICLNLPGASTGGRALRYYEIPYVGSFMLTQVVEAKLMKPQMGIDFYNLEQLDQRLEFELGDGKSSREQVAEIIHRSCLENHSIDARMNYIFGILDRS